MRWHARRAIPLLALTTAFRVQHLDGFRGGGKKILADPVSFYGRNFISNMEFRFLPKLIEFSKVFPPIALREIYAKTRTNHRMVVYTVCRGNSWFVDLKRECCFDERKKGEYL